MPDARCPTCGSDVPEGARFCSECGRPLDPGAPRPGGRRLRLSPALAGAGALVVLALVLFAVAAWAWGVVALLAAVVVLLVGGIVPAARWRATVVELRSRATVTREAMAARSREQVDVFRARRELADLEGERARLFRDLGAAVYAGDEEGRKAATAALDAVAERIRAKEAEIEMRRGETEERLQRAQAEARPTVVLEMPPEPATVPEPWPPPDEADRPDPGPQPAPAEPGPAEDEPEAPSSA